MADVYFVLEYPIFRLFDDQDLDVLSKLCEEVSLPSGQLLFQEGAPGDAMYIVKSGVMEVYKQAGDTKTPVNILSAGEFFGEMALIDGSPRSAHIGAQESAVLIKLSREGFDRLKKEFPATGFKVVDVLLKTLSFRLRRSTKKAYEEQAPKDAPVARSAQAKPRRKRRTKAKTAGRPKKKKVSRRG